MIEMVMITMILILNSHLIPCAIPIVSSKYSIILIFFVQNWINHAQKQIQYMTNDYDLSQFEFTGGLIIGLQMFTDL